MIPVSPPLLGSGFLPIPYPEQALQSVAQHELGKTLLA